LSVICDQNKIPLGISYLDTNLNKTKTGKHTFIHEIKGLQKTLNTIPINVKPYVKVNLIGDKGYISSENFKVFGRNVKLITPKRKNQKTKNTKIQMKILLQRHKIENFFVPLKRKDRISFRKERRINNYMSFVYINVLEYLFNIANKSDKNIKLNLS
jgi:hypothetical protein